MSDPADDPKPGPEPDYRFSLANERTFLAWVRTSLALLAAGVGVIGVASHFSTRSGREILGLALIVLAGVSTGSALLRWKAADRAIRADRPLPAPHMLVVLGVGLSAIALIALLLVVS